MFAHPLSKVKPCFRTSQQRLRVIQPARSHSKTARPQGQSATPQGQSATPRGQPNRPQGLLARPQGQPARPQGQSTRPQGLPTRPQGQSDRPQGQPGHVGDFFLCSFHALPISFWAANPKGLMAFLFLRHPPDWTLYTR